MNVRKLTAKQHLFLQHLHGYVRMHGIWPTYRQIMDVLGYRSPHSVSQNLQALHRKRFLRRDSGGYHLVDSPLRKGIPIRGVISAGHLQEAVDTHLGTITLKTLFPHLSRMFAIRVSGASMMGADIQDGDYVLLLDDDIPNGGIGAVLYNGETSLKRIYADESGLRLEPANPDYRDIRIDPGLFEEVSVLGRYVGHVNKDGIYKRSSTHA